MSAAALLLLLAAPPFAREPVGGWDFERIEDPLERRVASLLAADPVVSGTVAIVPLYARTPSEAGHGKPSAIRWAGDRLVATLVVEDGRSYLRIVNPTQDAMLLAAGTVFADHDVEVAVARDAVIPASFAALVPAGPLHPSDEREGLLRIGSIPPLATGSLLAGLPAFALALRDARVLRGEDRIGPVLESGVILSRRAAMATAVAPEVGGLEGTAVGAVFLVGDRPVAAHVFARHDLFVAALPDLLLGVAVAARDEELRNGRPAPWRKRVVSSDSRSAAVAWLRGILRSKGLWSESYGAGFETTLRCPSPLAVGHAVVDQQRALVHAGFYAVHALPGQGGPVAGPVPPPNPPGNPGETPTGFRERRPRPTVEDQRRGELNPNPGPHPGGQEAPPGPYVPPGGGSAGSRPR